MDSASRAAAYTYIVPVPNIPANRDRDRVDSVAEFLVPDPGKDTKPLDKDRNPVAKVAWVVTAVV